MSKQFNSMFRSVTLVGGTLAALTVLSATTVLAQAPRPDFPGAKQGDVTQPDVAASPRPDFPGAKQGDSTDVAKNPRPDFPGAKQSDSKSQK
jgi:hypothetical protein